MLDEAVVAGVATLGRCSDPSRGAGAARRSSELEVAAEPAPAQDFASFFDRMLPIAIGVARRIVGDEASAEDAASEALARTYLRWEELRASDYREAWVVRVTTNEALGILRKQGRRDRILRRQPPPSAAAPADGALYDRSLADQILALPRRQREVVTMRYFAEMSTEEVAAALDISPGSVKTHLHRGVAALRAQGRSGPGEALDG